MLVLVKEQRGLFGKFDEWTMKASPGKEVAKADILIANESWHMCYSFVFERSYKLRHVVPVWWWRDKGGIGGVWKGDVVEVMNQKIYIYGSILYEFKLGKIAFIKARKEYEVIAVESHHD